MERRFIIENTHGYAGYEGGVHIKPGTQEVNESDWKKFKDSVKENSLPFYNSAIATQKIKKIATVACLDLASIPEEEAKALIENEKNPDRLRAWLLALGIGEETQYLRYLVNLRSGYVPFNREGIPSNHMDYYYRPTHRNVDHKARAKQTNDYLFKQAQEREERARKVAEYARQLELQEKN